MQDINVVNNQEKEWKQIKNKLDSAENHAFNAMSDYCDVGDMLRQERAKIDVENFGKHVSVSLNKTERWARMVMKLSFYRAEALNHTSFKQAYEAIKALPNSEEETNEKASWPSNKGKGGGAPKGERKVKKTKPKEPAKVGWKNLIKEEFPLVTDSQLRNGSLVNEIKNAFKEKIPQKMEVDSPIADKLRETFKPIYEVKFSKELIKEVEEEIIETPVVKLTDKQILNKAIELHKKKLDKTFDYAVHIKVQEFVQENLSYLHEKIDKLISTLDTHKAVFTDKEFKAIRGCLHSDRIPEDMKAKYEKAFNLFEQNKERLCGLKPTSLEGVSNIPRTTAEFIKRRVKR